MRIVGQNSDRKHLTLKQDTQLENNSTEWVWFGFNGLNDLEVNQEVLEYYINKEKKTFWSVNASLQLYLWQVSDVHLHVAALTGPVQPLHVHIQRPDTQQDTLHYSYNTLSWDCMHKGDWVLKDLPVIGDVEVKVADMRCIFRENNVAGELPWGEPEGKVWNIIELEFCVNPVEVTRMRSWVCNVRHVQNVFCQ